MIKEKFVLTRWSNTNKLHYESLGYKFSKIRDFLEVNINHLSYHSSVEITAICDICTTERLLKYYQYTNICSRCSAIKNITSDNNRYAVKNSQKLKDHARSLVRKGSENNRWNPNLTANDRVRRRASIENINWSRAVKVRDNFICQICLVGKKYLHSHHLMSYAANAELRCDVDNGVTLCKKCHYEFHNLYGFINTNKCQFEEFKFYKQLNTIINSVLIDLKR